MKDTICTVIGLIGGAIAALFGGWDTALQTLVIFMAIDYITGLVVAGVFHASLRPRRSDHRLFGQRGHLHRRECRPDGSAHPRSHHQGHRHPQAAGRDARERQGLI